MKLHTRPLHTHDAEDQEDLASRRDGTELLLRRARGERDRPDREVATKNTIVKLGSWPDTESVDAVVRMSIMWRRQQPCEFSSPSNKTSSRKGQIE